MLMQIFVKIVCSIVVMGAIDFPWIKLVMKPLYEANLRDLIKVNGSLNPRLIPAVIVYLLLSAGITTLVLNVDRSFLETGILGAMLGLTAYGVYDFTNLSILESYTFQIAALDVLWGAILVGSTSVITQLVVRRIFD